MIEKPFLSLRSQWRLMGSLTKRTECLTICMPFHPAMNHPRLIQCILDRLVGLLTAFTSVCDRYVHLRQILVWRFRSFHQMLLRSVLGRIERRVRSLRDWLSRYVRDAHRSQGSVLGPICWLIFADISILNLCLMKY